jgi:hypothetical protein
MPPDRVFTVGTEGSRFEQREFFGKPVEIDVGERAKRQSQQKAE